MSSIWSPFKDLLQLTSSVFNPSICDTEKLLELKAATDKNKLQFFTLLKNPPKSSEERKCIKEKKSLPSITSDFILDDGFIQDSLFISDFLDLNEISAVELLTIAEQQKSNYYTYGRCLISILMYWDGKRNLVASLRNLILCRKSSYWSFDIPEAFHTLARNCTDEIRESGQLITRLLTLLKEIDSTKEIEKLSQCTQLSGISQKFLSEVKDVIDDLLNQLSECLLFLSLCQASFTVEDIESLLKYLKSCIKLSSDKTLTHNSLSVLFTLLFSISLPMEDFECNVTGTKPDCYLLKKDETLPAIHSLIMNEFHDASNWGELGVLSTIEFVWSITISRILTLNMPSTTALWNPIIEQEENVLDNALAHDVFSFIRHSIIASENFNDEEIFSRLVHENVTDLIRLMPLKVKAIKSAGDEDMIQQMHLELESANSQASTGTNHFKQLMELIADLYEKDKLGLSTEFWLVTNSSEYLAATSRPQRHKNALLYKFVQTSGEQLPPLLYSSYIRMLTGFASCQQTAQKIFDMLLYNSNNGDEKGVVSWNVFFRSLHLYYEELRKQRNSTNNAPQQISLSTSRVIRPHEVEALRQFMKLISNICKQDELCCKRFYENINWHMGRVMFGLLQCCIPITLKADILGALASLAENSPHEIVDGLQQWTESSQLLTNQYSSGLKSSLGMIEELENVESKAEEFPLTLSFLDYLHKIPHCFDQNNSGNELDYLHYTVDVVFTKLYSRSYLRSEEKWKVAVKCLNVFIRILDSDMITSEVKDVTKATAYKLLMHVHSQGPFFKMIMHIIEDCVEYLSTYKKKSNMNDLVDACSLSLQLLLISLRLSEEFLEVVRANNSVMLSGLDKLLLGVSPQSGKSEHILAIMKLVAFNTGHPQLAHKSIHLISHMASSSPSNHRQLTTALLTSSSDVTQGFVEILDQTCDSMTSSSGQSSIQEDVLRLIIHATFQPHPNIAFILLGFGTDPTQTTLQDAGMLGSRRNCLHSIMSILMSNIQNSALHLDARLIKLCYDLLYKLCYNPVTSSAVLRYVRSSYDFFYKHLQAMPFEVKDDDQANEVLLQQTFLMKSAALEIFNLLKNQLRGNAERLIQLLFNTSNGKLTTNSRMENSNMTSYLNNTTWMTKSRLEQSVLDNSSSFLDVTSNNQKQMMNFLKIMDNISFDKMHAETLQLEQFIPSVVEQAISKCETKSALDDGLPYCDIKKLHAILESNVSTLNHTDDLNRKTMAQQDVEVILKSVVGRNHVRETIYAKLSYLNAWKEILEISIQANNNNDLLMTKEQFEQMLLSVGTTIVGKMQKAITTGNMDSELLSVFATSLLAIFTSFNSLYGGTDPEQTTLKPSVLSSLKTIIEGTVRWMSSENTRESTRIYLYAALLSYLQLCAYNCTDDNLNSTRTDEVTMLDNTLDSNYVTQIDSRQLRTKACDFINQSLITLLCKDAATGNIVCRTLSFACMDAIVQLNHRNWLQFVHRNGYLTHICKSIVDADEYICLELSPSAQHMYVFEQQMSLLSSIASTPSGAKELLQSGVLVILSECKFLQSRLFITSDKSKLESYRKLVFPCLKFCASLLSSLGGRQHEDCSLSVLKFLLSHRECLIDYVLDNDIDYTNIQQLEEWKLVTGILCQMPTTTKLNKLTEEQIVCELSVILNRIQRQMTASIEKVYLDDKEIYKLKCSTNDNELFNKISNLMNDIGSNLLTYLRISCVDPQNKIDGLNNLCFSPNLNLNNQFYNVTEHHASASIGTLVRILKKLVKNYHEMNKNFNKKTIENTLYTIENGVLLLFSHMNYFIMKTCDFQPSKPRNILFPTNTNEITSVNKNSKSNLELLKFKGEIKETLTSGGFLKCLSDIRIANSTGKISLISKLTRNIQRLLLNTE